MLSHETTNTDFGYIKNGHIIGVINTSEDIKDAVTQITNIDFGYIEKGVNNQFQH